MERGKNRFIYDIAVTAMFTALIAVCSWLSVSLGDVPFTLQTFGVFCAAGVLGAKRGTASVVTYILLGAVGLPVFHGFTGGFGIILGSTGGFMVGFIFSALLTGLVADKVGTKFKTMLITMAVGAILYYITGVLWYIFVFSGSNSFGGVLMTCVVPFLVPDALKITAAAIVVNRLSKYVK